jgi:hypothetical protein
VGQVVWTLLRSVIVAHRLFRLEHISKAIMPLLHAHGQTIPGVFVPTVATRSESTTIRLVRSIRLDTCCTEMALKYCSEIIENQKHDKEVLDGWVRCECCCHDIPVGRVVVGTLLRSVVVGHSII